VRNALPVCRLVFPNPKQLCQSEIGEWWVAGKLNQSINSEKSLKLVDLGFGSLIAPDYRWPNNFVVPIEQNGSVHLP
jgi:hypothetical protein